MKAASSTSTRPAPASGSAGTGLDSRLVSLPDYVRFQCRLPDFRRVRDFLNREFGDVTVLLLLPPKVRSRRTPGRTRSDESVSDEAVSDAAAAVPMSNNPGAVVLAGNGKHEKGVVGKPPAPGIKRKRSGSATRTGPVQRIPDRFRLRSLADPTAGRVVLARTGRPFKAILKAIGDGLREDRKQSGLRGPAPPPGKQAVAGSGRLLFDFDMGKAKAHEQLQHAAATSSSSSNGPKAKPKRAEGGAFFSNTRHKSQAEVQTEVPGVGLDVDGPGRRAEDAAARAAPYGAASSSTGIRRSCDDPGGGGGGAPKNSVVGEQAPLAATAKPKRRLQYVFRQQYFEAQPRWARLLNLLGDRLFLHLLMDCRLFAKEVFPGTGGDQDEQLLPPYLLQIAGKPLSKTSLTSEPDRPAGWNNARAVFGELNRRGRLVSPSTAPPPLSNAEKKKKGRGNGKESRLARNRRRLREVRKKKRQKSSGVLGGRARAAAPAAMPVPCPPPPTGVGEKQARPPSMAAHGPSLPPVVAWLEGSATFFSGIAQHLGLYCSKSSKTTRNIKAKVTSTSSTSPGPGPAAETDLHDLIAARLEMCCPRRIHEPQPQATGRNIASEQYDKILDNLNELPATSFAQPHSCVVQFLRLVLTLIVDAAALHCHRHLLPKEPTDTTAPGCAPLSRTKSGLTTTRDHLRKALLQKASNFLALLRGESFLLLESGTASFAESSVLGRRTPLLHRVRLRSLKRVQAVEGAPPCFEGDADYGPARKKCRAAEPEHGLSACGGGLEQHEQKPEARKRRGRRRRPGKRARNQTAAVGVDGTSINVKTSASANQVLYVFNISSPSAAEDNHKEQEPPAGGPTHKDVERSRVVEKENLEFERDREDVRARHCNSGDDRDRDRGDPSMVRSRAKISLNPPPEQEIAPIQHPHTTASQEVEMREETVSLTDSSEEIAIGEGMDHGDQAGQPGVPDTPVEAAEADEVVSGGASSGRRRRRRHRNKRNRGIRCRSPRSSAAKAKPRAEVQDDGVEAEALRDPSVPAGCGDSSCKDDLAAVSAGPPALGPKIIKMKPPQPVRGQQEQELPPHLHTAAHRTRNITSEAPSSSFPPRAAKRMTHNQQKAAVEAALASWLSCSLSDFVAPLIQKHFVLKYGEATSKIPLYYRKEDWALLERAAERNYLKQHLARQGEAELVDVVARTLCRPKAGTTRQAEEVEERAGGEEPTFSASKTSLPPSRSNSKRARRGRRAGNNQESSGTRNVANLSTTGREDVETRAPPPVAAVLPVAAGVVKPIAEQKSANANAVAVPPPAAPVPVEDKFLRGFKFDMRRRLANIRDPGAEPQTTAKHQGVTTAAAASNSARAPTAVPARAIGSLAFAATATVTRARVQGPMLMEQQAQAADASRIFSEKRKRRAGADSLNNTDQHDVAGGVRRKQVRLRRAAATAFSSRRRSLEKADREANKPRNCAARATSSKAFPSLKWTPKGSNGLRPIVDMRKRDKQLPNLTHSLTALKAAAMRKEGAFGVSIFNRFQIGPRILQQVRAFKEQRRAALTTWLLSMRKGRGMDAKISKDKDDSPSTGRVQENGGRQNEKHGPRLRPSSRTLFATTTDQDPPRAAVSFAVADLPKCYERLSREEVVDAVKGLGIPDKTETGFPLCAAVGNQREVLNAGVMQGAKRKPFAFGEPAAVADHLCRTTTGPRVRERVCAGGETRSLRAGLSAGRCRNEREREPQLVVPHGPRRHVERGHVFWSVKACLDDHAVYLRRHQLLLRSKTGIAQGAKASPLLCALTLGAKDRQLAELHERERHGKRAVEVAQSAVEMQAEPARKRRRVEVDHMEQDQHQHQNQPLHPQQPNGSNKIKEEASCGEPEERITTTARLVDDFFHLGVEPAASVFAKWEKTFGVLHKKQSLSQSSKPVERRKGIIWAGIRFQPEFLTCTSMMNKTGCGSGAGPSPSAGSPREWRRRGSEVLPGLRFVNLSIVVRKPPLMVPKKDVRIKSKIAGNQRTSGAAKKVLGDACVRLLLKHYLSRNTGVLSRELNAPASVEKYLLVLLKAVATRLKHSRRRLCKNWGIRVGSEQMKEIWERRLLLCVRLACQNEGQGARFQKVAKKLKVNFN